MIHDKEIQAVTRKLDANNLYFNGNGNGGIEREEDLDVLERSLQQIKGFADDASEAADEAVLELAKARSKQELAIP